MPIAIICKKHLCRSVKRESPCEAASIKYDLEYGSAEIEIHKRSIKPGETKVVIVDDLMANRQYGRSNDQTLIEGLSGEVVVVLCLIGLMGLKGREKLKRIQSRFGDSVSGKLMRRRREGWQTISESSKEMLIEPTHKNWRS